MFRQRSSFGRAAHRSALWMAPKPLSWFLNAREVGPSLMRPKHPAGDEIAKHGGGDERNRTHDNGNTVTTFHPPWHSTLAYRLGTFAGVKLPPLREGSAPLIRPPRLAD